MKGDRQENGGRSLLSYLVYFGLIGLAYLFVEIPLIQKFILFLGHPAYAMAAVLFTLLLFSGIGSLWSGRVSLRVAMPLLVLLLVGMMLLLPQIFRTTLGLPFLPRLLLAVALLAPLGFLMGLPFPAGIGPLGREGLSGSIPWMWAVNGSASVISAVLAALLALTLGFNAVLGMGAACYTGAWLVTSMSGSSRSMRKVIL